MTFTRRNFLSTSLVVTGASLSGCGYFLYPERIGQKGGKVDPTVVILDALGLLLGVIPGIVAFAVDTTNGTIYLPPGGKSAVDKHRNRLSVFDGLPLTPVSDADLPFDRAQIEQKLSTQLDIVVDPKAIQFYRVEKAVGTIAMVALD